MSVETNSVRVAAVQAAPVYLDRDGTTSRVGTLAAEAAAKGARVIVFPEAFVPTYPDWIWRIPTANGELQNAYFRRLLANSVEIPGPAVDQLASIARDVGAVVVVGVTERLHRRGTLFNTILVFGPDGELLARHRKLMPTSAERMIWGMGDGSSIGAIETPVGRLGVATCYENYMPLLRYALYADGVDLYAAPSWIWGQDDGWHATMRHIALEGRVAVISAVIANRTKDVPADMPGRDELYPADQWLCPGGSVIVDGDGCVLAGPLYETEGILVADIDIDRLGTLRRVLDVTGHYARPDVFSLHVNRSKQDSADSRGHHLDSSPDEPTQDSQFGPT